MGTNYLDFIREAFRILTRDGLLVIAEVKSRIPNVEPFLKELKSIGFHCCYKDESNSHFILLECKKMSVPKSSTVHKSRAALLPCIYKRR